MKLLALVLVATSMTVALAQPQLDFLNHGRPVLDAHNCYPYEGQWADRIDRALKLGFPVGIEQDIAWAKGRPVVTHTAKTTGDEPTLRDHFFERVRPIIEQALKDNDRAKWPIIILHFDFKSLEPETLRGVWQVLGEYQSWITTAPQTSDPHKLSKFDKKPLLVLTEDADIQEEIFFKQLKPGERLRVFGSASTGKIDAKTREERVHLMATLPPEALLPQPPTNFRRWWNNSWFEVEEGGQTRQAIGRRLTTRGCEHWSAARTSWATGSGFTPWTVLKSLKTADGSAATTSARARRPSYAGERRSTPAWT
jgi:hypothetical protein